MAKYSFTVSNSSLIVDLNLESGLFKPEKISFKSPSVKLGLDLNLFEAGYFVKSFLLHNIDLINGIAPTDLSDAFNKINTILGGVASSTNGVIYNTPVVYDTPANLPITFAANTIHEISLLCLTGTLTVTVDGESTVLGVNQQMRLVSTTTINKIITINSTTGTFVVTVNKE
jgi:hypothetical protein